MVTFYNKKIKKQVIVTGINAKKIKIASDLVCFGCTKREAQGVMRKKYSGAV
jgi:hypothetical protein